MVTLILRAVVLAQDVGKVFWIMLGRSLNYFFHYIIGEDLTRIVEKYNFKMLGNLLKKLM